MQAFSLRGFDSLTDEYTSRFLMVPQKWLKWNDTYNRSSFRQTHHRSRRYHHI